MSRIRPDNPSKHRGGSGEPLLLVHGGAGTWRLWKPTIPYLEQHHDVLAVTLQGHFGGPPFAPGVQPSIYSMADAVERDMDEAGCETAHVAGGSLGGWVALELAKRGRARSVVAISPGGGHDEHGPGARMVELAYRLFMRVTPLMARRPERWSRSPLVRRLLYWHHFGHPERMDPEDCAYMIAGVAGMADLSGFIAWAREHGGARDLDRIECPVRLVFPGRDFVLPRRFFGERLVAALPGADVIDLPGVGHAPMVDEPELTARTILEFTSRHAREPVTA